MPKGPKGQKRPADVIGNAVKVMRIATGEETEDEPVDEGMNATRLGRKGRIFGCFSTDPLPFSR